MSESTASKLTMFQLSVQMPKCTTDFHATISHHVQFLAQLQVPTG
jgi:hypothetical protein